jgi:hypothetical protein
MLLRKNPMDVIKKKHWWQSDALKWSVIGLLALLVGYLVVLMYAQGEYLFAGMTLILSAVGLYIFANRKAYAWRYVGGSDCLRTLESSGGGQGCDCPALHQYLQSRVGKIPFRTMHHCMPR